MQIPKCILYNCMWYSLSVTCGMSVLLSGFSGFTPQIKLTFKIFSEYWNSWKMQHIYEYDITMLYLKTTLDITRESHSVWFDYYCSNHSIYFLFFYVYHLIRTTCFWKNIELLTPDRQHRLYIFWIKPTKGSKQNKQIV